MKYFLDWVEERGKKELLGNKIFSVGEIFILVEKDQFDFVLKPLT